MGCRNRLRRSPSIAGRHRRQRVVAAQTHRAAAADRCGSSCRRSGWSPRRSAWPTFEPQRGGARMIAMSSPCRGEYVGNSSGPETRADLASKSAPQHRRPARGGRWRDGDGSSQGFQQVVEQGGERGSDRGVASRGSVGEGGGVRAAGMLGGDGIHVSPSARDRSRWRRPFSCWASVVALERCARVPIRLCIGGSCSVGESVAVIAGDDWCWWTAVWPWGVRTDPRRAAWFPDGSCPGLMAGSGVGIAWPGTPEGGVKRPRFMPAAYLRLWLSVRRGRVVGVLRNSTGVV